MASLNQCLSRIQKFFWIETFFLGQRLDWTHISNVAWTKLSTNVSYRAFRIAKNRPGLVSPVWKLYMLHILDSVLYSLPCSASTNLNRNAVETFCHIFIVCSEGCFGGFCQTRTLTKGRMNKIQKHVCDQMFALFQYRGVAYRWTQCETRKPKS